MTTELRGSRVLLVSHEATRTGAPRVAVAIAESLSRRGAEVVTVVRWDGPLRADLAAASTRVRLEPLRHVRIAARKFAATRRFANRLDEAIASLTIRLVKPDVVYANTAKSACYVRPALRAGVPVVLHVHELEPLASMTLARYDLATRYPGVTLVGCSGAAAANLAAIAGIDRADVTVVPSMVDAEQVRALAGSPDDRTGRGRMARVVACGTADLRKGTDRWERAAEIVHHLRPATDVEFSWLGDAADWRSTADSDTVHFVGEVHNPYPAIARADVFTMPSRVDPFPLAVLEAMALGRAVVAFDIDGVREQVGDCGVLVPDGDTDAFARAVVELLDDAPRRAQLGRAARERVEQHFGIERFDQLVTDVVVRARGSAGVAPGGSPPATLELGSERDAERVLLLHAFTDDELRHAAVTGRLPYRAERLADHGFRVTVSARERRSRWSASPLGRALRAVERRAVPFLQLGLASRDLAASPVVVAMFESQGNALAVLRRLRIPPFTRPHFVVVTCWLARELEGARPLRRALYRWAYRSVDALVFFSANQVDVFEQLLGLPRERLHAVPFGVDTDEFHPSDTDGDGGYVLAVGRDRGRDWRTLLEAVDGTDARVLVACRDFALDGLDVPGNVELLGVVDRDRYRELVRRADLAAVVTEERPYPTGQSVLLEAMASGRACVVTRTDALAEYVRDGVDVVCVAPGSSAEVHSAVERLRADPVTRSRLGAEAADRVARAFDTRNMWAAIAPLLRSGGKQ